MTTANILTLTRIGMVPVFLACAMVDFPGHWLVAFAVFGLAGLTDKLDGYIARKYNQVTTFGKFVDPLADKLLVISAIILFVETGWMSAVAAIIIVARELVITSLRVVAMSEGVVLAAGTSGKIKTATQIACILLMLLVPDLGAWFSVDLTAAFVWLGWIMAAVTLWSGADYCIANRKIILKSK